MKPRFYLVIAAIFWGLNFHFAAFMLKESSFIESATWRYSFGVIPLLLLSLRSFRKTNFKAIPIKGILLVGIVGLFGFNIFFFLGLKFTSPVNAALIVSLNPMITIYLSALILKTQITRSHIIGSLMSVVGVMVLLSKGDLFNLMSFNFNKGDFFIFIANIVFALQNVWVKQYRGSYSNLNFTTLTNFLCLLCFLLVLPVTSYSISVEHGTNYWIWALGIGVLGTAIAYLLWNEGISQIGADKGGIFLNIVPLATAISALLMGEQLYLFHLISGIIIIGGIVISQRKLS